jgi:HEPN domain-containing protein
MPPEPGAPADWLRFAESDLALAQAAVGSGVLYEMLCFHAQQAAEKSLKAVLLAHNVGFPRTHNLRVLRDLLPPELPLAPEVEQAVELSDYATMARYPGAYEPVTEEEYREAMRLAEAVVAWARTLLT